MAKPVNDVFKHTDIRTLKQHTTPRGTAVLCFLNKPSTEYNEDGVYLVKMRFPVDDQATKALLKIIDKAGETAYQAAYEAAETPKAKKEVVKAKPSYKIEEDDEGNPTGFVTVNFKRSAVRKDKEGVKKPVTLPIFDVLGRKVDTDEVEIWGNSELAISFKLLPYNKQIGVGVSHRLEAVQVIKAVAGGDNRTAKDYGFSIENIYDGEEEQNDSEANARVGEATDGDY